MRWCDLITPPRDFLWLSRSLLPLVRPPGSALAPRDLKRRATNTHLGQLMPQIDGSELVTEDTETLAHELADSFDMRVEELSPELRLCVERLEELRRRDRDTSDSWLPGFGDTSAIAIRLASSRKDREAVYRLRAKAYVASGWLKEADTLSDEFDEDAKTVVLSAHSNGSLIGTIRVNFAGDDERLPCDLVFDNAMDAIRNSHDKIAEFGRIAVSPDLPSRSYRTTAYGRLISAAMLVTRAADIDYALVAVHQKLSFFYQRMVGLRHIADSAGYGVINEPTALLGQDFAKLVGRTQSRNSFFHVSDSQVRLTREILRGTNPELI